jgi:hypothetical protein
MFLLGRVHEKLEIPIGPKHPNIFFLRPFSKEVSPKHSSSPCQINEIKMFEGYKLNPRRSCHRISTLLLYYSYITLQHFLNLAI